MIRINKDPESIPASLQSQLTNQRRKELIENRAYLYESIYDSRYKYKDIKQALKKLYNHKCAFCEHKIERFDVEHFRPKKIYYWLAYSWDNLLLACPTCNGRKNDHFDLLNERVEFQERDLNQIHSLVQNYNRREQNKFIHPELEDVEVNLVFKKNGSIHSENERIKYTIDTCKLDRNYLNDRRKTIFDDHLKKLKERYYENQNGDKDAIIKIKGLKEDFQKDSLNEKNEFLAFRRYAVKHFLS